MVEMAAFTRHCSIVKTLFAIASRNTTVVAQRSKQSWTKTAAKYRVESEKISLRQRGFLRPVPSYFPSSDVSERLKKIVEAEGLSWHNQTAIKDPIQRFKLFITCENEFKYAIPNSLLFSIQTVGDLETYYKTPVNTTVPLDDMVKMDLPPNLHVMTEYHRFHPDTDTMFGGKTAFPESSTLVTGLKYKKKYPGHSQKAPWRDLDKF